MHVRVIYRRDRYLRGGDHIPFLERRYPAARFTEPNEDYAHQHQDVRVENGKQFGDLPEFCDFAYIARVARVNARDALVAGDGTGHPEERQDRHRPRSTNDTALAWDADPEADLAGYEVVWRPTLAGRLDPRHRRRSMAPRTTSTCRRTTCSSASAPSTATVTAARSPSPCRRADHRGPRVEEGAGGPEVSRPFFAVGSASLRGHRAGGVREGAHSAGVVVGDRLHLEDHGPLG